MLNRMLNGCFKNRVNSRHRWLARIANREVIRAKVPRPSFPGPLVLLASIAVLTSFHQRVEAVSCPLDPTYGVRPPRAIVANPQTGVLESFAAKLDAAYRPWIAASGKSESPSGAVARLVLARLGTNGMPDPSFGQEGILIIALPGASEASTGGIDHAPNGDVVVAWSVVENGDDEIVVVRVSSTGALRESFGREGITRIACSASGTGRRFASAATVDTGGRVLVALNDRSVTGSRPFIARLTSDGNKDSDFGSHGCVDLYSNKPPSARNELASDIAIDDDGRVLVARIERFSTTVLRFADNGLPDTSFGFAGFANVFLGRALSPARLSTAPGRRVVLAQYGYYDSSALNRPFFGIAMLTESGSPELSFDGDGLVQFLQTSRDPFLDSLSDVVVAPTGSVTVVGQVDRQVAVARFGSSGAPDDTDCNAFGTPETGFGPGSPSFPTGVGLHRGRVVVTGHAGIDGSQVGDLFAIAVLPGLVFANDFE